MVDFLNQIVLQLHPRKYVINTNGDYICQYCMHKITQLGGTNSWKGISD